MCSFNLNRYLSTGTNFVALHFDFFIRKSTINGNQLSELSWCYRWQAHQVQKPKPRRFAVL